MSSSDNNGIIYSPLMTLEKDWIDYNGHLNMAFYNVLFDRGCDVAFEQMGMGPDYAKSHKRTIYTAESHVRYLREIHLGDKVRATFQIIDHDEKRLHVFQELQHEDGWISATSETLALHVDMTGPNVTTFEPAIAEKIATIVENQKNAPRPDAAGARIEIRRKKA